MGCFQMESHSTDFSAKIIEFWRIVGLININSLSRIISIRLIQLYAISSNFKQRKEIVPRPLWIKQLSFLFLLKQN